MGKSKSATQKYTFEKAYALIENAVKSATSSEGRSRCDEVTLCGGYSEQGYTDPKSGVIAFGNWNDISVYNKERNTWDKIDDAPKLLADALEKIGVELEWSDEWMLCDECQKAVRTSSNGHGWKRGYAEDDSGQVCAKCVDPVEHLEKLEGTVNCLTLDNIDPEKHGYTRLEHAFENGLYGGQSASPKLIAKALREQGIERFIFELGEVRQFDIDFRVCIHDDEIGKFDVHKFGKAKTDGEDPAEMAKKALQSIPPASGEGVQVSTLHEDGTATTKMVSHEDFVKGKALEK